MSEFYFCLIPTSFILWWWEVMVIVIIQLESGRVLVGPTLAAKQNKTLPDTFIQLFSSYCHPAL